MEVYYTLIILIFSSCLIEFVPDKKLKINILVVLCMVVALFGGLRWNTGNDWDQYYSHFQNSNWDNIFNYERFGTNTGVVKLEPGFVFINVIIKLIFPSFYWYNIIICSFIQYAYYKFSTYHCPSHPVFLYAVIQLMSFLFFPVRAGLAVAVCLWGYKYVKEQKLVRFVSVVAVASLIHYQCLIFFPLYWIGKIKLNKLIYIIIYIAFFILGKVFQSYFQLISLLFSGDIGEKMLIYSEYETEGAQTLSIVNAVLQFFLFILYLNLPIKKMFNSERWYYTLINVFLFNQCVVFVFTDGMGELARIKDPFAVVPQLLFVIQFLYLYKSKYLIIRGTSFIFFVIYMIRRMSSFGTGFYFKETCLPYRTIFDYNGSFI